MKWADVFHPGDSYDDGWRRWKDRIKTGYTHLRVTNATRAEVQRLLKRPAFPVRRGADEVIATLVAAAHAECDEIEARWAARDKRHAERNAAK